MPVDDDTKSKRIPCISSDSNIGNNGRYGRVFAPLNHPTPTLNELQEILLVDSCQKGFDWWIAAKKGSDWWITAKNDFDWWIAAKKGFDWLITAKKGSDWWITAKKCSDWWITAKKSSDW